MRPERCLSWCIDDNGVCRFCGWPKETKQMGLRIYDITIDNFREPTQADIDELAQVAAAYIRLRSLIDQNHAVLQDTLRATRSKAGLPA